MTIPSITTLRRQGGSDQAILDLLHCNTPTTPAVLRSEADAGFTYLVMPVQVRS